MNKLPRIAITMGDPCGIGPEVVFKALATPDIWSWCRPVVVGSVAIAEQVLAMLEAPIQIVPVNEPLVGVPRAGIVEVLDPGNLKTSLITQGKVSADAGTASMEWVYQAARLCLSGRVDALVTAPVNKEACNLAGYTEIGHMEVLQELTKASSVATMLMAGSLRVVHLTTHRSLKQACDLVTKENVLDKLRLTHEYFGRWGLPHPRIGVAALNPHGSDGGLLGDEEISQIVPAIEEAQNLGITAVGPIPADIVFTQAIEGRFDVVLAMYHDQGHIPIKVHDFHHSVSVNLGLPLVRTSVDHGTAFDIAGKGVADHRSMLEALSLAAILASGEGLPH